MKAFRIFAVFVGLALVLTLLVSCSVGSDGGSDTSVTLSDGSSVVSSSEYAASSTEQVGSSDDNSNNEPEIDKTDKIPQKIKTIGGNAVIYKFNENIYKLEVPFSGIYTSVFFVNVNGEHYIIDTGSNATDVTGYVVPAMNELGIGLESVKGILLTHTHGDHAGGLSTLAPLCPNAVVYGVKGSNADAASNPYSAVYDGFVIGDIIKAVTIKGHDTDACGYIDTRSNTLISGDSLQLHGIASWGCQVRDIDAYLASMQKLQGLAIENILVSHAYCPSGAYAVGAEASQKYIQDSIDCLETLIVFTESLYSSGTTEVAEIQSQYVALMQQNFADFPTNGFDVAIKAIINQRLK